MVSIDTEWRYVGSPTLVNNPYSHLVSPPTLLRIHASSDAILAAGYRRPQRPVKSHTRSVCSLAQLKVLRWRSCADYTKWCPGPVPK